MNGAMTTPAGTWFVMVQAPKDNYEYQIWFNYICPANCSGQGSCNVDADKYGTCSCNQNYVGLMCKQDNMIIE